MIMCVCTIAGYLPVHRGKQRARLLGQLERDIGYMSARLHTGLIPIPELLTELAEQAPELTAPFYGQVSRDIRSMGAAELDRSWDEHLMARFPLLTEGERTLWSALGHALGKYRLEDELAILGSTARALQAAGESCRQQCAAREKVSVSLGVSLGLFFVIVLL